MLVCSQASGELSVSLCFLGWVALERFYFFLPLQYQIPSPFLQAFHICVFPRLAHWRTLCSSRKKVRAISSTMSLLMFRYVLSNREIIYHVIVIRLSQWFSGKIRACHARAPCSIHGCDNSFSLSGCTLVACRLSFVSQTSFYILGRQVYNEYIHEHSKVEEGMYSD